MNGMIEMKEPNIECQMANGTKDLWDNIHLAQYCSFCHLTIRCAALLISKIPFTYIPIYQYTYISIMPECLTVGKGISKRGLHYWYVGVCQVCRHNKRGTLSDGKWINNTWQHDEINAVPLANNALTDSEPTFRQSNLKGSLTHSRAGYVC